VSLSGPAARPEARADAHLAPLRVRQAFALTGVAPLGVFLVVHLALNARALAGGTAFASTVRALHALPGLSLLESLLVFGPLVFHGALGTWLILARRSLAPSPYPPALRTAMRLTAMGALAFLAMHLPEVRFHEPSSRLDGPALATVLDADLSTVARGIPWRGIVYLAGSGCVVFHFACGVWGFVRSSDLQAGRMRPRFQRYGVWGAVTLGVVLWLGFADVIVLRATGAKLFGGERADVIPSVPCMVPPSK
jgi:succinate dehydrogenase/fumarate reductase cytochrome b subunit